MKFEKYLFICAIIIISALNSLHPQVATPVFNSNQQMLQQQTAHTATFLILMNPWKNAFETYAQKNNTAFKITCKNCTEGKLSLGEFDGNLLALIIKAIPNSQEAFEKIEKVVEEFIQLLDENAPAERISEFMLNTANNMKITCHRCHGTIWEKRIAN